MSNLRITGLATGLDIDNTVKQMMKAHTMKVDKLKQDRQIVQWRQDLYRELIGSINTFKSTYFDILKPEKYMLSTNSLSSYDITNPSNSSVKVTANSGVLTGEYKVKVNKLATSSKVEYAASGLNLNSKLTDANVDGALTGITLDYNGTSKTISLNPAEDSIGDLISRISSETSGNVVARYSQLTGKFTLETVKTGIDSSLTIDSGSLNFFNSTGVKSPLIPAQDSEIMILAPGELDYVTVTRASNNFTIDGINYSLTRETGAVAESFSITKNTQNVFDKIKEFVEKYNETIDKINDQISQKKQYKFPPLTDEQKKEMKEDEIKKWEEKAKEGLLSNDSTLENMLSKMRGAFFHPITGVDISLSDIGLSTSSDISQRGKIIIDETKLKNALNNNEGQVIKLLSKASDTSYVAGGDNTNRYNTEGIFQRLNDIINDNVRTVRDTNGKKGFLLEKAGIKGDFTEFNNILSVQLKDKDRAISMMEQKLAEKENKYYLQFAQLEKAMQKMNDQSNWLSQQLGSMGG